MKDLWGCIVLAAIGIVIVGGAFALHPIVGLAVLIGCIGFAAVKATEVKEEMNAEREKERKAEADRIATIEQEKLNLERQKLELEQQALQEQRLSPEERAERDKRVRLEQELIDEKGVMEQGGLIREHGTLSYLADEKVTCENGHHSTYGKFALPDGRFCCPTCQTSNYQFDEEIPGRFHFCGNRLRKMGVDRMGAEWPYLHSFRRDADTCPLCAWATAHGITVQPHNFDLHERTAVTTETSGGVQSSHSNSPPSAPPLTIRPNSRRP